MKNTEYEIIPFISIGDILFTDNRATIRNKIGGPFDNGVYDVSEITELYDYFPEKDIKVLYDKAENLNAVEFYNSQVTFPDVIFLNKNLFSFSYKDIQPFFLDIDNQLETDSIGFISHKYGIGIGIKGDGEDEDERPDSIIVFKNEYYHAYKS